MKLLLYGINYAPEIISVGVYSSGLAEWMAKNGVETRVVTALPHYPAWRVFEGWRGPLYRRSTGPHGISVVHCPLYVPAVPSGARRIVHHASFAVTALPVMLWTALRYRPDVVMVVVPSMVSAPVAWLAARLAGARSWMHIQDLEVEAAFATGLLKENSRVGAAARAFERWLLRRFDRISTISPPMIARLREKKVPDEILFELRNWADLSRIAPQEGMSPLRAELGIDTPRVALYSGNLANKQGLDVLPRIARQLAHRTDLTIAVCGDGPMRQKLVEQAAGLDNIRFFPLQPVDKLNDLLAMADLHLLPQIAGAADLVLPSKLTNMLASGRPVVATAEAGTSLAAEVEGAGLLVDPGDAEAAAAAIERLLDDDDLRAELGQVARTRALARWDMDEILTRLKAEFERMTAPASMQEGTR